jgi:uncharacterized membrane protein YfcA
MRKSELIFNLFPLILVIAGMYIGLFTPDRATLSYIPIILLLIGFVFLLKAKWFLFRSRKFFTFGPSEMTERNRYFYKLGYALILIGFLLSLVVLRTNS